MYIFGSTKLVFYWILSFKIKPNGIKPNFQKAVLNFRPKIKKVNFQMAESFGQMGWRPNGPSLVGACSGSYGRLRPLAHPLQPTTPPTLSDHPLQLTATPAHPRCPAAPPNANFDFFFFNFLETLFWEVPRLWSKQQQKSTYP